MSANVSLSGGTVSASAFGVSADSQGNVSFDGLVSNIADAIDKHAPKVLTDFISVAADESAKFAEIEGAATTAIDTADSLLGLSIAAGPLALFVAVAAVMWEVSQVVGGANDCCTKGHDPRFGGCDPAMYSWYGPQGLGGHVGVLVGDPRIMPNLKAKTVAPTKWRWHGQDAAENFVGQAVIAAHDAIRDCHHGVPQGPPLILAFTTAVAAWNRTHQPYRTIAGPGGKPVQLPNALSRNVNYDWPDPYGGSGSFPDMPDDPFDPISVVMNFASSTMDANGSIVRSNVRSHALASVTLHRGPVIPRAPIKLPGLAGFLAKVGSHPSIAPHLAHIGIKLPHSPPPSVPRAPKPTQQPAPDQPRELLDMAIPGTNVTVKEASLTAGVVGFGLALAKKLVGA